MVPQIAISLVERFTDVRFNWTTKTLQSFLEVVYWSSVTCETYSLYGDVHFSLEVCTFVGAMMSVCDEVVLQFVRSLAHAIRNQSGRGILLQQLVLTCERMARHRQTVRRFLSLRIWCSGTLVSWRFCSKSRVILALATNATCRLDTAIAVFRRCCRRATFSVSLSSGLDHLEDIDRNQIEKSEYGYWEEQVLDDPFMVLACRLVKIQHALKSFGHVVEMEAMDVYENLAILNMARSFPSNRGVYTFSVTAACLLRQNGPKYGRSRYLFNGPASAQREKVITTFGDVKFFITGGSAERMISFAHSVAMALNIAPPYGYALSPIGSTSRYALYKVGPVLVANHGIGMPSISILLHEVTKLLEYAGAYDITYIRMGTSGGIGVEPGTIVITSEGMNNKMECVDKVAVLGSIELRPSICSPEARKEIITAAKEVGMPLKWAKHSAAMTFTRLAAVGVCNIEMEARFMAGFCHKLNIPVAVVCVTLLNRLNGDQVLLSHETLQAFEMRPATVLLHYIKTKLCSAKIA
ncbi:unnamed protein product [Peronospora belbahrii]|uniref:Nucleoside phosphorylase domain-containing protein n=1 Tax=Peronospora belbahrii TaxID=622444 RepID=A0ABN8CN77_9STRA|nr:unnamed protein product [Peronospora belbahrii]